MLFFILLGIFFAISTLFIGRLLRTGLSVFAALVPLSIFIWLLAYIPAISAGGVVTSLYTWVPSLGINLSFRIDGVSLLFGLLISGIGTLVFLYTSYYLKDDKYLDRFYAYLGVFMAAMLGVVFSDNIISLFVFWELTSISSFFLIGYKNEDEKSRKAALTALLITGMGGLLLLAGGVITGYVAGSFEFSELLLKRDAIIGHALYPVIAVLFFLAAFTKSAQFPFHFWLPGAMKAPTPVSTYLHSATMVKAGVYLLLRFTPVLGNTELWNTTITAVGGVTMLYAALHLPFKKDLKEILAFTTISALGIMVFLIGIGTPYAIVAVLLFILTHALYKASLFLITGIIDHGTHSRDITELGGLKKVMMPVALAGFTAALISGGVPPTLGFISKDLMYETTLQQGAFILLTAIALVTSVLQFYGGFLTGVKPFIGKLPQKFSNTTMPNLRLWGPPVLLVTLGVLFGLFPSLVDGIIRPGAITSSGQNNVPEIKLWHGFNLVLLLSAVTIGLGILMCYFVKPVNTTSKKPGLIFKYSPEIIFHTLLNAGKKFSRATTRFIQNGSLPNYVFVMISFMTGLLIFTILNDTRLVISKDSFKALTLYEITILSILVISVSMTLFSRSRLVSLISLSVIGLSICILFVFYSAPDLAMTQFSVDTLTVILFVLVLFRLPKYLKESVERVKWQNVVLAIVFGAVISVICLKVLNQPVNNEITNYYAENAYTLAKGKNVVNVILVDFRGMDTLIEICVLIVAALGVFSLIKASLKEKY